MNLKHSIRTASVRDQESIVETITLGFASDPIARWIWPEASLYLKMMPDFVKAFGGKALEHNTAQVEEGHKAAALWLPPGTEPDGEVIDRIFGETVRSGIAEDVADMFAQMNACHPSAEACWYLPMIATDPAFVGQGVGSVLLKRGLQRCDKAGEIAYLESSNPRNISLYLRHGFEQIGEIQTGSSPKVFPMIRQPFAGAPNQNHTY
ncbi:MAG: GNAT family N-acetyltransferase [Pseudomonadota bacterium]